MPSRSDQVATSAATIHCLTFGGPAIGHSALAAPTRPSEKVQMVSTQPELPVRCCTRKAPAIRIEREAAIRTRAARQVSVMQIPISLSQTSNIAEIRGETMRGFNFRFPFGLI